MARRRYVPDRGDFVWLNLNPRRGHEQAGRRPALVLSPKSYNRTTGLCVICPATRQEKGYAFEVGIETADGHESVILADHVRSVDWRARKVSLDCQVEAAVLEEVVAKLFALIVEPDG